MSQIESLASLMGWLSFASWLLVYTPQFYENYINQSGEGVSISFILIWALGDLTNLFGSWKQNLLPTMIILAIYYTLCDILLAFQIFYYRYKIQKPLKTNSNPTDHFSNQPDLNHLTSQTHPLLSDSNSNSSAPSKLSPPFSLSYYLNIISTHCFQGLTSYFTAYTLICFIGFTGWLISQSHSNNSQPSTKPVENWDLGAQIAGWISAASYLGSRIPQILKNKITKCKGLSLLFFLVGITGNVTYVASILIPSREFTHIWINMSWLVGSAGTILLDLIVLFQFWDYRHERQHIQLS
ncbi:hypothetical protein O181_057829 [Austropuccinia psidii MF-1]|uniref:PQ-loop-domain-containing protein n=1 Tax=Austropuccinia psidii MF-1 TaxID=1389203 RepID=A0A9Q3EB62_9BASI|nr:hypothetical protein [Austropuccinia psidii MF-1]